LATTYNVHHRLCWFLRNALLYFRAFSNFFLDIYITNVFNENSLLKKIRSSSIIVYIWFVPFFILFNNSIFIETDFYLYRLKIGKNKTIRVIERCCNYSTEFIWPFKNKKISVPSFFDVIRIRIILDTFLLVLIQLLFSDTCEYFHSVYACHSYIRI